MSRHVEDDPFINFITQARTLGFENTPLRRFYSKYPGRVEEVKLDDRGLVRVCVGEILGTSEVFSVWARPDTYAGNGYGLYLPVKVGDPVWVTFANGDPTQPRYSGGWWLSPSDAPNSATSYLPEEFKNPGNIPSTYGLIVPNGYGWLFEEQLGRDQRFEVWTGTRTAPRSPVTKHHQVLMSDEPGNERVEINTFKGHKIHMVDIDGLERIEIETKDGRKLHLIDIPGGQKIELESSGRKVVLDDVLQRASLETPTQSVVMDDIANTLTILSPGAVNVQAGGAVNVQGAGVNIDSLGGVANMVGQGAANMEFAGAMIKRILSLDVISNAIKLGDTASAVALVTEAFIQFFNTHTHNGNLGAPTGPPIQPATVAAHATQNTKAS